MSAAIATQDVKVRDVPLRIQKVGEGPPLIALHGLVGPHLTPGLASLAEGRSLVIPEHPGFGEAARPDSLRSVGQLALLYLDLLDELGLRGAPLLGHSFGGWVAAEMATLGGFPKLVLVDALGCRIEGEKREDIFLRPREEVLDLVYRDRALAPTDGSTFEDVRNLNALAHYGWNPYLCDLSLRERLHRVEAQTLLVWGADDRVVPATHAKVFAAEIANHSVVEIADAGHDPASDRPEAFTAAIRDFLGND